MLKRLTIASTVTTVLPCVSETMPVTPAGMIVFAIVSYAMCFPAKVNWVWSRVTLRMRTRLFPIGGAIWSMLGKIVGSQRVASGTKGNYGRLPAQFVSTVFRVPLISAKRLKRYFLQLSEAEQEAITAVALRRKMNTCVQIRRLCEDDSQDHLGAVLIPYCNGCCTVRWGKRRSEVRLELLRGGSSRISCTCGSTDINVFMLRGFVVTCGPHVTRLCSKCGVIICDSEIYYVGVKGVCKKCSVCTYPSRCLVCESPATYFGVAEHTVVYGLCSSHTSPFHYSASLADIRTVLHERSYT